MFFLNLPVLAQFSKNKLYSIENDDTEKPKILTLYQTSAGLILCGTTKGLYRFDGFDFSQYAQDTGNRSAVTAILETRDKKILVGFSNGSIAAVKNNTIQFLSFEEGFPKTAIRSIIQDQGGMIWFATAGEGIYYIQNNRLYNINEEDGLSDNYIYKLIHVPQKGIIAASDRGINTCSVRNNKKYISTYTSKDGLPDNIVRSLYMADSTIWMGMQDAGIAAYSYNFNSIFSYPHWKYGQVNDIHVTPSNIYVATEDSGLVVLNLNKKNKTVNYVYTDYTISKLTCILKDREGNIWVAGENQLLRTGKTQLQQVYHLTEQQAAKLHCLHYSGDSALWFNIPGGLMRLYKQDGQWKNESFNLPGFSKTTITALYEDPADNLWVGSLGDGLAIFNHKKHTYQRLKEPLLANNNTITISGGSNIIWISGLEGVVQAKFENGHYNYTNFTDTSGIGNKYVYNILCDDKERIWFATDGEGISVLDDNKFTHLKNQKGYTGDVVYKVIQDKYGNIWYATYDRGLIKYDGKKFTAFTTSQGLGDMTISGLLNAGNYIAVVHKNIIDIVDPATNKITYLDKAVMQLDINNDLNACTNDNKGSIFFVSGNTIYSYTPDANTVQQPVINIDRVELFLQTVDSTTSHSLNYRDNNLSLYYTGLYYSDPEKIQYQYKLEGYDKEWITTRDRVKNFPNLPPGDYVFRVKASLNKNFSNAVETAFSFTINKPFWQQPLFLVASIIIVAILLYFFIRQREKGINNLNTLKNEKIQFQLETLRNQVNPHFLFNSFNILISEIENNAEDAVTYVERMADFYRRLIQSREKDIISLENELNILHDYIFLQEKRFASGLEVKVNINPEVIQSSYVPPLVLQMLVENAIKHNIVSKERPLQISITDTDKDCLAVSNNINRKVQPENRTGLGLENIQKRYNLLQIRKVSIESDDKFFTVKIPLIKK